jgi:hypothetical protein
MKTDIIIFNVRERHRKWRGQERNFETGAMARLINSPAVQERVKRRDMPGYLGHWVRERYGMEPPESVIHQGKVVALEPALVTVRLEADPDGTVRHQAEFLDTPTGRSAERMWSAKVGGFSTAVSLAEREDIDFPLDFHGLDFVNEPNFSSNRGYALDGVTREAGRDALDAVVREHQSLIAAMDSAYGNLQSQVAQQLVSANQALEQALADRDLLVAMLAKRPDAQQLRTALDASHSFTRPTRSSISGGAASFEEALRMSATIELAGFAPLGVPMSEQEEGEQRALIQTVKAAAKRLLYGR